MSTLKAFSPVVLRIGIAAVFVWFGISQLSDVNSWTGFVPDYAVTFSGLSASTIVYINGFIEIILGSMLLFGLFTRIVAFLLALHILDIMFTVGFNAIGVRDFGLSIATIAIFLNGSDWFSLDHFIKEKPAEYTSAG